MDVVCPQCRYSRVVDEATLPEGRVAVRCPSCENRFSLARARSVAVMLSKGGVGKTTIAVHVAAGLALAGYKTLLVDADTQGQAAFALGVKPTIGLAEYAAGDATAVQATVKARNNLWLLAGGKSLAGVKRLIDRRDFGGEKLLTEILSPLEFLYDFIILDTAPSWDAVTVNVLFYAKEIMTPVALEVMSVQSLFEFLKSFNKIRAHRKDVAVKYLVPIFLKGVTPDAEAIVKNFELLYGKWLCTPIRNSQMLAKAPAFGMTVFEYAPDDPVAYDFKELLRDVVQGRSLLPEA